MNSTSPLTLSQAIREGAKLRPQWFGQLYQYDSNDQLCSCALGAAVEAVAPEHLEVRNFNVESDIVEQYFPTIRACLILPDRKTYVRDEIERLNDQEHLAREAIADQVEAWGY